jgi:Glycosyl hydrolases family 2
VGREFESAQAYQHSVRPLKNCTREFGIIRAFSFGAEGGQANPCESEREKEAGDYRVEKWENSKGLPRQEIAATLYGRWKDEASRETGAALGRKSPTAVTSNDGIGKMQKRLLRDKSKMPRRRLVYTWCAALIALFWSARMLAPKSGKLLGRSFELIYFTKDQRFDGRSNFREAANKPEISTNQRIRYLQLLARRLEHFEGQHPDEPVVSEQAVEQARANLKPLPLPVVRKTRTLTSWKWQIDANGQANDLWSRTDFDERDWNEGRVPFVRETHADLWFRRHIPRPAGGRAFLEVEAAIDECWIWVNGQQAVHHQGYGPFRAEITQELSQENDNVIAVRIPAKPGDQIGLGDRVRLISTGDQQIENIFAFTKNLSVESPESTGAEETVRCTVANLDGSSFKGSVRADVSPWNGPSAAAGSRGERTEELALAAGVTQTVEINVPLERAALWSPGRPNLYQVHVWLLSDGRPVDDYVAVTGIRKIEQRSGRLYLNDRPFFAAGFLDMVTYPPQPLINPHSLMAPPDDGIVRAILTAQAAGANTLRIHPDGMRDTGKPTASGYPPFTSMTDATNYNRYAEIADQLGICLIWPTRFWGWQASFFDGDKEKQLREDLPASIRLVRNHPSIIFYEGMNEVGSTLLPGGDQSKVTPEEEARESRYRKIVSGYVRTVSALDPTRLISPDSGWVRASKGPLALEPYFADQATFDDPHVYWDMHAYFGWYDAIAGVWPVLSHVSDPQFRKRAFILSEFGSEAMPNWSRYEDQPWYGVWVNNARTADGEIETRAIGRPFQVLENSEYKLSQAYQALLYQLNATAVRDNNGDGMFACTLGDGYAMGFYHKGAVDVGNRAKLGWVMARMVMQEFFPNGTEGDMVFGPQDSLNIRVSSVSASDTPGGAALTVTVRDAEEKEVERRDFNLPKLDFGATAPVRWQPKFPKDGFYFIEYELRNQ